MLKLEPIQEAGRPAWWRTALLMLLATLGTLMAMAFSPEIFATGQSGADPSVLESFIFLLGLPLAALFVVGLGWRHRWPAALVVVYALTSLIVPLGNALPLIALACLIGRRRGPGVLAATCLVALTSTWVAVHDAMAQPVGASFIKSLVAPVNVTPEQEFDVGVTAVVTVLGMGWLLSVGIGWLVRTRRLNRAAQDAYTSAKQESSALGDDLARQRERELIAREVHDALGHRLSLLNLHAGAMEANAGNDPRQQESARLIRESAGAAMSDLRSLLDLLHSGESAHPVFPLSDLPTVVEEAFGAGHQLSSSIFIRDAETAPPQLTNAVYRIVQELLTNARRHAPSAPVTLRVNGGPDVGITVDATNPAAAAPNAGGTGRGLVGIAERARLLGGSVRYGHDGPLFRVRVHLPWMVS